MTCEDYGHEWFAGCAKDGDAVSPGTSAALVAVVLLGIGLMVLIAAEAVYTIGWQTSYRGNFWCDVAG